MFGLIRSPELKMVACRTHFSKVLPPKKSKTYWELAQIRIMHPKLICTIYMQKQTKIKDGHPPRAHTQLQCYCLMITSPHTTEAFIKCMWHCTTFHQWTQLRHSSGVLGRFGKHNSSVRSSQSDVPFKPNTAWALWHVNTSTQDSNEATQRGIPEMDNACNVVLPCKALAKHCSPSSSK